MKSVRIAALSVVFVAACATHPRPAAPGATPASPATASSSGSSLDRIDTVVVIFAENRAFDVLYGSFPGANGIANASTAARQQVDRDGTVLKELPPVWNGLTVRGVTPVVTEEQTAHLPNAPFGIDDPTGLNTPSTVITHDLVHRFYQNQMQINGGRNDRFVAYGDAGALQMGHYDTAKLPMFDIAREFTLADNFFMGAFGGSYLNHQYLICACAPFYPDAGTAPAKPSISKVEPDGVTLTLAANSPASAMQGPPKFERDGNLTPDFYSVNTMEPPYQPSSVKPAAGGDPRFADPASASVLPPQTHATIGDLLSAKGISWAWYSGAWQEALNGNRSSPTPNFQFHHQPFNYYQSFAPGTAARAEHLRDGGFAGAKFIDAIDRGELPHVAFYKPQGNLNEHSGYADVMSGDQHIADVISHLKRSPQWAHMLVVVTYDENGGYWDHVAPPAADRWGPGTRVPAIIVSPFAKRGTVDHTLYDTSSILRFVTRRWSLPELPGLKLRDDAMAAKGTGKIGDLTGALK